MKLRVILGEINIIILIRERDHCITGLPSALRTGSLSSSSRVLRVEMMSFNYLFRR